MTHRDTLHRLIKTRGEVLTDYEFRNVCLMLYGITHDREVFNDLLIRDASTDGAFLLQGERDALLHVINGGSLDVSLADTRIPGAV